MLELKNITKTFGTFKALDDLSMTVPQYMEAVSAVTAEDVVAAAKSIQYHSSFFLKGVPV